MLNRSQLILLATAGSAAMMLGAWGFQYIGHMAPCKLCYWQRYPHLAAIAIGVVALALKTRALAWLGALAALATAGVGLYHTGVERQWWQGPTSCTSGSVDGMSAQELLNQILAAPLVRCDEVAWQMFGLSMASWNAVASLGLAAIWILAATRRA